MHPQHVLVNGTQTMSYEPPAPPTSVSSEIVERLNGSTAEELRNIATYAEELAEHKDREARLDEESDENDIDDESENLPSGVPTKATITIKEINDNKYYYWQWREGEKIRSKYKGPAGTEETESDN